MLVPNCRSFEENNCAGWKVMFAQAPALHRPEIDSVGLMRVGARRESCQILPSKDVQGQVGRRGSNGLERFNKTAYSAVSNIRIVRRVNWCRRQTGQSLCHFRWDEGPAVAIGENGQKENNCVFRNVRQLGKKFLIWKIE